MGNEFTFYDYIDADGSGTNVISDWLNGDGNAAKGRFAVIIPLFEASPPRGFQDSVWREPYVKHMHGDWEGFIELRRKAKRVQYRILGQIDDRSVFLVACGTHKGDYTTDITPQAALERVNQMKSNPARYRRKHEYN